MFHVRAHAIRPSGQTAIRMLLACAVMALFAVSLAACSKSAEEADRDEIRFETVSDKLYSPEAEASAEEQPAETGEQYWDAILTKYQGVESVKQILLVKYLGGWDATTQFYVKSSEGESGWSLVLEDDSYVGRDGAGTASYDRATTPMGDFEVLEAFGICADPGTALPYVQVTSTVYASCECSEDCPYFNTIHDVAQNGHWECSGEHMIEYSPDYDYGLNFDYNPEKDFYKGSAFFIHCKSYYPYTGGCVALDYDHMITVLQMAEPGMRVVIADA